MIFFRCALLCATSMLSFALHAQNTSLSKDWAVLEVQDLFGQDIGPTDPKNDGNMIMLSPTGSFYNSIDLIPFKEGTWHSDSIEHLLHLSSRDSTTHPIALDIMTLTEEEMKATYSYDEFKLIFHFKGLGKHETRCDMRPERGECAGQFHYYYFDTSTQQCASFFHGGCGGVIPFKSLAACQQACHCEEH